MGLPTKTLLHSFNLALKTGATAAALTPIVKGLGKILKHELAKGRRSSAIESLSKVGADALSLAYKNDKPDVAGHLADAAVDLLLEAIREDKKDMVKTLSEIFVEGLLKARENKRYESHVDGLVEKRRKMFNEALVEERENNLNGTSTGRQVEGPTAEELATMATTFLTTAIELRDRPEEYSGMDQMVHYFSASWVRALEQGVKEHCMDSVTKLIEERAVAFKEAIKTKWGKGQVLEAEILSEAAAEVLLRAVERAPDDRNCSDGQVRMFAQSWVSTLHGALSENPARVQALVLQRTMAFKDAFVRGGKEATTVASAAIAVLLAAVEKGYADLNLILTRSWFAALDEGAGYGAPVAELLEQMMKEFMGKFLKGELTHGRNSGGTIKHLSRVGVGALSLAYENGKPNIAEQLATAAIDLLLEAIRNGDKDTVTALSEVFVEGLVNAREKIQYERHVDWLVEERRRMFNKALVNERDRKPVEGPTADELAEIATIFLTTAIGFQIKSGGEANRYPGMDRMVHYFSTSWVKALKQGIQDRRKDRVRDFIADRTVVFMEAMKSQWEGGQVLEAEILSEAAAEVLLRAVEGATDNRNDSDDQVRMFAQSWVDGLDGALSYNRARVEAVVHRRTMVFKDAFGHDLKEAKTLANAAIAVLLASVEKEYVDLNLILSRSWVTALEGENYDVRVAELVKQRTEEFKDAVTRRDIPRAKILSKAAIAILLAAVERSKEVERSKKVERSKTLVDILADSWAGGLGKVVAAKIGEERDDVCRDAAKFAETLQEGPHGVTKQTLQDARQAIIDASEKSDYGGVSELICITWPIVS